MKIKEKKFKLKKYSGSNLHYFILFEEMGKLNGFKMWTRYLKGNICSGMEKNIKGKELISRINIESHSYAPYWHLFSPSAEVGTILPMRKSMKIK